MRISNQFSPAPADLKQTSDCAQAATGVEDQAVEQEYNNALDSHSFQRESLSLFSQRVCSFAAGASSMAMLGLGAVAVGDALAGQIQGWVTIFGVPLFGLATVYLTQLSRQYGNALLDDYAFECRQGHEAQQVAGILADELITARAAHNTMFRAYRAAVAADPADGDAGRISPRRPRSSTSTAIL